MSGAVESIGGELMINVARGSDCVFGVELRDDSDDLRSISTLLVWLDGVSTGFTWTLVEPGSFTVVLPRTVTLVLDAATTYSIGFIDESGLHQAALAGQVRVSRGRLGTET